jgi:iron complex outermembrane receptor protein
VEAAALHAQSVEEAPASVTVITAEEIARYGYRTLGEALSSVRGFYDTYDRMYHYIGVRGFSLPGDFNNRFLVMINGHAMTDNVYGSNTYFGQDFPLDMDLVERIEVVPGPSSALYGSNGMLATVNVVTRLPVDAARASVSVEAGSFGEKKAHTSAAMYLGGGANLLVSASLFHNRGQTVSFAEYNVAERNYGLAEGMDAERGHHAFLNLVWRDWSVLAVFGTREKQAPLGFVEEADYFQTRGNRLLDERGTVSVIRKRTLSATSRVELRIAWDRYRYRDRFDYLSEEAAGSEFQSLHSHAEGDWVSARWNYQKEVGKLGRLTVGSLASWELQNLQHEGSLGPNYEEAQRISRPDRSYAGFVQQETELSKSLKSVLAVRLDDTRNFRRFVSPRAALVWTASPKTIVKAIYGRPFRNPSAYEQYYEDGTYLTAAGPLRAESAHSIEGSFERKLGDNLRAVVNAFSYRLRDLIQAAPLPDGVYQYQNVDSAPARGIEMELRGKPREWLETAGGVALQRTRYREEGSRLPNSPRRLAHLRIGTPLPVAGFHQRVWMSGGLQYVGARRTVSGDALDGVLLAQASLSVRVSPAWDLRFGVRNLLDRRYEHPVALSLDRMTADGRSVFLKLVWRTGE